MPKLWNETVREHRSSVREAVLDAVAQLVAEGGVPAVSMTRAAEGAGISRATLYKYFPDVEALLSAWHERQVEQHVGHLRQMHDHLGSGNVGTNGGSNGGGRGGDPVSALRAVLEAYALMLQQASRADAPAFLHASSHTDRAQEHLRDFLTDLIEEARTPSPGVQIQAGQNPGAPGSLAVVRSDVPAGDLALLALHAVNAAASAPTPESARALVGVLLDGMIRPR